MYISVFVGKNCSTIKGVHGKWAKIGGNFQNVFRRGPRPLILNVPLGGVWGGALAPPPGKGGSGGNPQLNSMGGSGGNPQLRGEVWGGA
jgi:hypothetical protein